MALDITGKIIQVLDLQTGTSARGDWKKQEFILETDEQYPRKICISLWGDRIGDIAGAQIGEVVTVSIAIESREFNGRWYTEIRGWRIQRGAIPTTTAQSGVNAENSPATVTAPQPLADDFANVGEDSLDDLPF
jgi:hypothetical protein